MDPQKTEVILNKKNNAGGITSTVLKIHCSQSDHRTGEWPKTRTDNPNRPAHQHPTVFVIMFVLFL